MPPATFLVGRGYVATSVATAVDIVAIIHVPRVTTALDYGHGRESLFPSSSNLITQHPPSLYCLTAGSERKSKDERLGGKF
jgi:hypothetical protein